MRSTKNIKPFSVRVFFPSVSPLLDFVCSLVDVLTVAGIVCMALDQPLLQIVAAVALRT